MSAWRVVAEEAVRELATSRARAIEAALWSVARDGGGLLFVRDGDGRLDGDVFGRSLYLVRAADWESRPDEVRVGQWEMFTVPAAGTA